MFVMPKKHKEKIQLYVASSIFLNYMKQKCAMEMKRHAKFLEKAL